MSTPLILEIPRRLLEGSLLGTYGFRLSVYG